MSPFKDKQARRANRTGSFPKICDGEISWRSGEELAE